MTKPTLTQKRLKELLHYDPETGDFTNRTTRSSSAIKGNIAGSLESIGYVCIRIDYVRYWSHRLAWLYMTGDIPEEVDHINHDRSDNKWSNLKWANKTINTRNKSLSKNNTSGINGVFWDKRHNKWYAEITANHKKTFLGYFVQIKDAGEARKAADIKYGFHPNHGKINP